jgi:hypothetical protein
MVADRTDKCEAIKNLDIFFILSSLSAAGLKDIGRKRKNNEDDFYWIKKQVYLL